MFSSLAFLLALTCSSVALAAPPDKYAGGFKHGLATRSEAKVNSTLGALYCKTSCITHIATVY